MAFIHEKLYKSKDAARIEFSEYAKDLATNLQHTYGADNVEIDVTSDHLDLNVDTAIPCGLILSELLSNCLTHAFRQSRKHKNKIRIDIRKVKDGNDGTQNYVLKVIDNGVGLPAHLDVQSTDSLGLLLIRKLTEQLRGSIAVERDNGTTFQISFQDRRVARSDLLRYAARSGFDEVDEVSDLFDRLQLFSNRFQSLACI